MVKEFLSLMGHQFTEHNVSVDLEGRRQLIAMGFDSTPVTVIGDRVIKGFDGPVLQAALAELERP
jgi:hypothetical protein